MNIKFGKIDGYKLSDYAFFATICFYVFFKVKLIPFNAVKISLTVFLLLVLYSMWFSKSLITNESNNNIVAKNKEINNILISMPGTKTENAESIKINGIVHKIPDGLHLIINKNNSITINSIFGKILFHLFKNENHPQTNSN